MKYLVTADWHAHAWSQFATLTEDGINSRLEHLRREILRMASFADSNDIGTIYVAGDVFHVRGSVRPSVLNPLIDALRHAVHVHGVGFRIMPGNHDLEGRETTWLGSAISALAEVDGVHVIDRRKLWTDDRVVQIPWCGTAEGLRREIEAAIEDLHHDGEDHTHWDLHLHAGINGVIRGMPDHGWHAEELAAFGFKRVFAGHYHNHKVFEIEGEPEVFSIGALTHQTWSDVGTRAGFMMVGERQSNFGFMLSSSPRFIDFDLDLPLSQGRGNYVRIRGLELDEGEMRTLRDGLIDNGAEGVVIHPMPKVAATERPRTGGVTLDASVSEWIRLAAPEDPVAVETMALDILNEARSVE